MLKEIFKNNILYLLREKNKTLRDLQNVLKREEISLLAIVTGDINHTVRDLRLLGDFFDIDFQKFYEPLTEETFELFDDEKERNEYKQNLMVWQEALLNRTSSSMNKKWEKRREFTPKK